MAQSQRAKAGSPVRAAGSRLRHPWRVLTVVVCAALLAAGSAVWWRSARLGREREEALRLSGQGRFAEAEPLLQRALGRNDRDVAAVRALALGYLHTARDREAETYLDRWCTLEPDRAEPHVRRMDLAAKLVQAERALAEGERLLELEPGDREMQRRVAGLLIVANRYADAESACRRFLQRNPDADSLRYLLAEACHLQGKEAEAVALLDPLLDRQPPLRGVLVLRATIYADADQAEKAIPLLRQALALDPWDGAARYQLSQALARTGQAAEAQKELAEMLRQSAVERLLADSAIQPDNLDLQARAAEMLLKTGRTEEGLRRLRTILARDPGHAAALRLLAAQREARAAPGNTGP